MATRGRPPKEEVTSRLLATGEATMAQIAQLFNTDAKTLPKRMRSILPKRKVNNYNVYSIREAASVLVQPGYEIEDFIRQMSPQEMPPLLSKEFWNGQNARLNYEKALGNLWPTEEVVAYLGELTNTIRMSLLLVGDAVERETGVTDGQRDVIRRIMDAAVADLREAITDKFKEFHENRAEVRPIDIDDWNVSAADDDDGNLLAAEDDSQEADDI